MSARPNILLLFVDQQRWDTLGVYGSPMGLTPNLDALARQGVRFDLACTVQPVCAPARGTLLTGQYATRHGVWKNGIGLADQEHTVARALSQAGYQTAYVGKWHLAPRECGSGAVPPEYRAGFVDFWEAANALEMVSHPNETVLYAAAGNALHPTGYRVDALTDRALHFIREVRRDPFFLMVSYLEPHHQNDWNQFVAPEGYAERYANPFVPHDLRPFPGDWQTGLPGYYGTIARIDECVGRIVAELARLGILDNTLIVFTSDHGCHFRTRNAEYKRSCHDSSVRVPLLMRGPGFDGRLVIPEPVGLVDVPPTLLQAAGLEVPDYVQGRPLQPLVRREIDSWREEVFIQISESQVARALRTPQYTYCAVAPDLPGGSAPGSDHYVDAYLYDNYADPFQWVNLNGRREYAHVRDDLRQRLVARMVEAGEPAPTITLSSL